MIVVADSSALLALAACDSLLLLDRLYPDLRVPTAVFSELAIEGKPRAGLLSEYLKDKVHSVVELRARGLGRGETEALSLCLELASDLFIVDDRRAPESCAKHGSGSHRKPWCSIGGQTQRLYCRGAIPTKDARRVGDSPKPRIASANAGVGWRRVTRLVAPGGFEPPFPP